MEFWKTKRFKELSSEWNDKLKASGFEDAESDLRFDRSLKQRATNSYRQADQLTREARLEYFIAVGQKIESDRFFDNLDFFNRLDQVVMIQHSQGQSIAEICEYLSHIGLERDRKTIRFIIRRWQMKWGIREWSLRQMNLKK